MQTPGTETGAKMSAAAEQQQPAEGQRVGVLMRHKLALRFSGDDDFVFATETGGPMYYRNVSTRGLDKATNAAGLNPEGVPSLVMHDLRHTYGSHLVLGGLDVVRVSRQMGHKKPSITLDIHAKELEQVQHSDKVAESVAFAFGGIL